MKAITAVLLSLLIMFSGVSSVGAQSYEGTSLEEGIYYLPADPGPGSIIRFAASGLVPNSEVEIRLVDANRNELDGLTQVQGVVVVRADAAGNVNADLRLPANIGGGTYILVVDGQRSDLTAFVSEQTVQVAAAAAQNTGDTSPGSTGDTQPATLALTGSETESRLFGGIVLVALGLGLVLVASRRRGEISVDA